MNFLVLALCMCAVSAASYDYQRYKSNKPFQQFTSKTFAQAVVKPAVVAPIAKTVYNAVEIVATAPTASAKTAYNAGKEADAATLRFDSDVAADGYKYNFETANGIVAQASGILKKVDDTEVVVSQGSYHFVAPDGTLVDTSYVADENGYQPRGSHIPAVPEAILRSLEYIRTNTQKTEK